MRGAPRVPRPAHRLGGRGVGRGLRAVPGGGGGGAVLRAHVGAGAADPVVPEALAPGSRGVARRENSPQVSQALHQRV